MFFNTDGSAPAACGSSGAQANNLNVDPEFINTTSPDFHTQRASPVVAAGDINAPQIPPADFDARARTVCGTIDMGIYEIHPQPPIALTSSPNPSVGGSSVTFTATVQQNCNVPTDIVTFLDGTTVLGTGTLNGSAVATFSTASLTVGSHNITATYPGDFNFDPSTSSTLVQVVTGYPTQTSLQVLPNPAAAFQTITLVAEVSSQFGTPTGTVTFFAGTTQLATATTNANGFANATTSTLGAGTYNITAVYSPTVEFAGSTSPVVVEVVNGAATVTIITSVPNPSAAGQSVAFAVSVRAPGTTGTPTGTVTFFDGATAIGTTTLGASGGASFSTSALTVGQHPITASYGGGAEDNASTSNTVIQTVLPASTTTSLTASPNPANLGDTVTFTSTVATVIAGLPTPTGSVLFFDQNGLLGTAPIVNGQAVFTTSTLSAGTHDISAGYSGTLNDPASASVHIAEVIDNFDFTMTVTPTAMTIPSGDYEILTVTITPLGGFPGSVNMSCGSLPANASCNFDPTASKPLSGGPQTMQLIFNTSQVYEFGKQVGSNATTRHNFYLALLLPLLGVFYRLRHAKHPRLLACLILGLVMGSLLGLQGCSGKQPASTPPGAYTFSIQGRDATGRLSHTVDMALRVTS